MKKIAAVLVMVLMAAAYDWSLSQISGDTINITIKNQLPIPIRFYINSTFISRVEAGQPYSVQIKIKSGPIKLDARSNDNTKIVASKAFDTWTPGMDIVWETGKVELEASQAPTSPQAGPESSFPGRTMEEVFVAVKMALADCQYTVKTSEKESGLVYAEGKAFPADGKAVPRVTILVFMDPTGTPGVKIQYFQPGQAGDSSNAGKKPIEEILAALRNILR